ncbi:MAG: NmrA family NAD(P)-binding protein, partial [Chloroflexota bacterium]|nr:NmrA family NAD(P)-binding protein [Chloroflexota bacterium]
MADNKVIAVVGATGAQGGGLADAILRDPDGGFTVRALTRNPESDAATALASRGAEVVAADLDDQASLSAAFVGAHGVFGVTNYWELFSVEREQAQAANIARASVEAGVHHVIW